MRAIYPFLLLIAIAGISIATFQGLEIDTGESGSAHLRSGLLTAMYLMFLHCLVMFYLIGSGKDVKNALEDAPDLWSEYIPRTKRLKKRCFPFASMSILLVLLAAFAGAYVHSELLTEARRGLSWDVPREEILLPVRQISLWWLHIAIMAPALLLNLVAFALEFRVIRDNGALIRELNERLARRLVPGGDEDGARPERAGLTDEAGARPD